jgi:hypothetical protein
MKTSPKAARPRAQSTLPVRQRPSIAARLASLPRLSRIALAALFALAVTLVVFPLVDSIYLQTFFDERTRMIPALVSAGVGAVMYAIGWRLLVGYVGETPTARPAIVWYVGVGMAALIAVALLLLYGAFTSAP